MACPDPSQPGVGHLSSCELAWNARPSPVNLKYAVPNRIRDVLKLHIFALQLTLPAAIAPGTEYGSAGAWSSDHRPSNTPLRTSTDDGDAAAAEEHHRGCNSGTLLWEHRIQGSRTGSLRTPCSRDGDCNLEEKNISSYIIRNLSGAQQGSPTKFHKFLSPRET